MVKHRETRKCSLKYTLKINKYELHVAELRTLSIIVHSYSFLLSEAKIPGKTKRGKSILQINLFILKQTNNNNGINNGFKTVRDNCSVSN